MRVPVRRLVVLMATVLVGGAIAPLAGAADSDPKSTRAVPPEEWVHAVCSTLSQWYDDTSSLEGDFATLVAQVDKSSVSPAKGRKDLVRGARDAVRASDVMISKIERAGTPQVNNGKSIQKRYLKALAELRGVYERTRVAFGNVKTKSKNGFLSGSSLVMDRAVNDYNEIDDPMGALVAVEDLSASIAAEPACVALIASPGSVALGVGTCIRDDDIANVVPCTEPHIGEVYAMPTVADFIEAQTGTDAGPGAPYPGEGVLQTVSDMFCGSNFIEFMGATYDESVFDYGFVAPSKDQWASGQRRTLCIVYPDDQQPLVGSAQGLG